MKPSPFPASQMASKTAHPLLAEAVVASGTCSSARRFCVSANCSKSCDRFCRTSSGRSCGWHIATHPPFWRCCTVVQKKNNFQVGIGLEMQSKVLIKRIKLSCLREENLLAKKLEISWQDTREDSSRCHARGSPS